MYIKIQFSESSLFDGTDANTLEHTDIPGSIEKYQEILRTNLTSEYPNAEIEIEQSINDRVLVDGETDNEDMPVIQEIIGNSYQDYDAWWIEK